MEKFIPETCNWCGESLMLPKAYPCNPCNYGLAKAEVSGGYSSTPGNGHGALDDQTSYEFSICEFCLDHLFEQFRIPPKVLCFGEPEVWKSATQRISDEPEHRRFPEEFFPERDRRAERRKR